MAGEDKIKAVPKQMSPQDNAKAQALKEARFLSDSANVLLNRLESGNITPYATGKDMGLDIRVKMRQSVDILSSIDEKNKRGKGLNKKQQTEEEKAEDAINSAKNTALVESIRKAVGRLQIIANPISEEGILIPYLSEPPKSAPIDTKSPQALINEKYEKKQEQGIEGVLRSGMRLFSFGGAFTIKDNDKYIGGAIEKYCETDFADKKYPTCKGVGDLKQLEKSHKR